MKTAKIYFDKNTDSWIAVLDIVQNDYRKDFSEEAEKELLSDYNYLLFDGRATDITEFKEYQNYKMASMKCVMKEYDNLDVTVYIIHNQNGLVAAIATTNSEKYQKEIEYITKTFYYDFSKNEISQ